MPELPEVQCVVDTLKPINLKEIEDVIVLDKKLREPVQNDLKSNLKDKKILEVQRRGKFIIFKLNNGFIVSHLGMTGKFLIQKSIIENKFNRIIIKFKDNTYLIYNDIRKFGFITYENNMEDNKYIKKLGIEPLSDNLNGEVLFNLSRNNKKNIKQFLLDQSYIVGLGNIYVIELMYLCGIDPLSKAKDLTKDICNKLSSEIKRILTDSIKLGGSSISDYRDANDKEGSFQDNFFAYGRKFDDKGHKIERIKQNGRSTYYCPICQNNNLT